MLGVIRLALILGRLSSFKTPKQLAQLGKTQTLGPSFRSNLPDILRWVLSHTPRCPKRVCRAWPHCCPATEAARRLPKLMTSDLSSYRSGHGSKPCGKTVERKCQTNQKDLSFASDSINSEKAAAWALY